jgi:hypothetical protein
VGEWVRKTSISFKLNESWSAIIRKGVLAILQTTSRSKGTAAQGLREFTEQERKDEDMDATKFMTHNARVRAVEIEEEGRKATFDATMHGVMDAIAANIETRMRHTANFRLKQLKTKHYNSAGDYHDGGAMYRELAAQLGIADPDDPLVVLEAKVHEKAWERMCDTELADGTSPQVYKDKCMSLVDNIIPHLPDRIKMEGKDLSQVFMGFLPKNCQQEARGLRDKLKEKKLVDLRSTVCPWCCG